MLSQPPVNEYAANIINKIKDYLRIQVNQNLYEEMLNKMSGNFSLTSDEAIIIASYSDSLVKINLHLSQYITISGNDDITSFVKDKVFDHLKSCFEKMSGKFDTLIKNLDFTKAI